MTKVTMRAARRQRPASVSTSVSGGHLCSRLLKSDVVCSTSLERRAVRLVASGEGQEEGLPDSFPVLTGHRAPGCQDMGIRPLCAELHSLAGLGQLLSLFPCQVPRPWTSLHVGQDCWGGDPQSSFCPDTQT